MEQVAVVQHRSRNAGAGVALVTFSVDPETDTPEKLHAYARRFRASPYRWNFLTGELTSIEKTVVKGFKLAMGREKIEGGENLFNIFHSERLVLVDQKSQIRGYYEANKVGIDKLILIWSMTCTGPAFWFKPFIWTVSFVSCMHLMLPASCAYLSALVERLLIDPIIS